ncbi:four-helix bundle copper-binding protein [Magnetospirillum sp. SS-4]|uniref:four-helix bundle copper-binding protein n=1 Tax=Magnetospirillum sp. SS-4 TaxID=2681465 RepID=UPI0013842CCE|nr:four-helix bundle copper-binding protein [Magnetospirillum sp. SS-4]CAA7622049.1 Ferredoxin [Magnetospirillum sp. SS-4]
MPLSDCIDACELAHRACTETVIHGLQHGGKAAEWELVQLLLDCADINETAADFMLRSSRLHHLTCQVAAEVSDICASACEKLAAEDVRLRECAQACRRAATACRKTIKT